MVTNPPVQTPEHGGQNGVDVCNNNFDDGNENCIPSTSDDSDSDTNLKLPNVQLLNKVTVPQMDQIINVNDDVEELEECIPQNIQDLCQKIKSYNEVE